MRKKLITLTIVFLMVGSLFAEGSKEASQGAKSEELLWMNHTGEEAAKNWEDLMAQEFNESRPNVTIDIQRMSFDSYTSTLQTKIAAGDAPDLFTVEGEQMKSFHENGYLADMSGESFVSNYNPKDLELVTLDGEFIAAPMETSTMAAFYNKDVFEAAGITKVPTTLSEFQKALETLKNTGVEPIATGYKESWCLMADMQADYITSVLASDSNAILDLLSRKTTWSGSELWKRELERLAARYQYASSDPFGTDWNRAQDMVANGSAAMLLNGSWAIGGIRSKNPDVNIGIFAVPFSENSDDARLLVMAPSSGTSVFKGSSHLRDALDFMGHFTSKEAGSLYAEMANRISIIKDSDAPSDPAWQDVSAYIQNGQTFNLGAVDHNFPNEYRVAVESIVSKMLLFDDITVDKTLELLDEEFDRIASH